jgi:hypothetical protein
MWINELDRAMARDRTRRCAAPAIHATPRARRRNLKSSPLKFGNVTLSIVPHRSARNGGHFREKLDVQCSTAVALFKGRPRTGMHRVITRFG